MKYGFILVIVTASFLAMSQALLWWIQNGLGFEISGDSMKASLFIGILLPIVFGFGAMSAAWEMDEKRLKAEKKNEEGRG